MFVTKICVLSAAALFIRPILFAFVGAWQLIISTSGIHCLASGSHAFSIQMRGQTTNHLCSGWRCKSSYIIAKLNGVLPVRVSKKKQ